MPRGLKAASVTGLDRRHQEPLATFATRIPRSLRQRVRLVAEQGRALQEFVAEALREYLHRRQRG